MSVSFEENFLWQPSGPVLWPTLMGAWRGVDPHWMPKERLRDLLSWESAFFSNSREIFSFVRLLKVLPVENIGPGPRWVTISKPRPVKHLLPWKETASVDFMNCFKLYANCWRPKTHYYSTQNFSKVGCWVRIVWHMAWMVRCTMLISSLKVNMHTGSGRQNQSTEL